MNEVGTNWNYHFYVGLSIIYFDELLKFYLFKLLTVTGGWGWE